MAKREKVINENEIGEIIVDAAVTVHKELGPGLLESIYEIIFAQTKDYAGKLIFVKKGETLSYQYHQEKEETIFLFKGRLRITHAKNKKKSHEKIGNAIEELYQENLDEYCGLLAGHFIEGENYEKGAEYSRLAVKKAEKELTQGYFNAWG